MKHREGRASTIVGVKRMIKNSRERSRDSVAARIICNLKYFRLIEVF